MILALDHFWEGNVKLLRNILDSEGLIDEDFIKNLFLFLILCIEYIYDTFSNLWLIFCVRLIIHIHTYVIDNPR